MTPPKFHDPTAPVQPDQFEAEFTALLDIYRSLRPLRVLEIGVREGGSLYQWMKNAPGAVVCAVDLPGVQWGWDGSANSAQWALWAASFGCDLRICLADSHGQGALDFITSFAPYDFVFIDGDHSAAGVLMDVITAIGSTDGSVIALHDICPDDTDGAIEGWRVWPFLRRVFPATLELTSAPDQNSRGIGVLYV